MRRPNRVVDNLVDLGKAGWISPRRTDTPDTERIGPVAVAYPVADDNEAVEVANATGCGLGGSVLCADLDSRRYLLRVSLTDPDRAWLPTG
ncbi:aldehyde dehydrogenase family protein (plasmid) [Embleya sp. NBC_00888]|uniref:aldehyde dehydrogenase family protein n=1 Tax=Embleya sp. NBC_00888 TaxID=2975960 RepID=UPI002F90E20F|nr:aldehyde dehydrogenase family protein [Embleya sp. NBC_00888]